MLPRIAIILIFDIIWWRMKRLGNLFTKEKLTIEVCEQAIIEAARHKRKRSSVIKVLNNLHDKAEELREMVLINTFTPSPYSFEIRVENGKLRKLLKPRFFPDQAVHHLLILTIRDNLIRRIDPYALASIPKRGPHSGVKAIERWVRRDEPIYTRYCGKGDIEKCFESIHPKQIMRVWEDFIKDKLWLSIMRKVVYSCSYLPLGNYCSAWLLNLMLKDFDEAIRRHPAVHFYIRYMDDFVFFASNKRKARGVKRVIIKELDKLSLLLKSNYQVFSLDKRGLDFLGYRIFRGYTILRRRNLIKLYRSRNILKRNKIFKVRDCQSIISRLGGLNITAVSTVQSSIGKTVNLRKVREIISEQSKAEANASYVPKVILIKQNKEEE